MTRIYPQITREDAEADLASLESRLREGRRPVPLPDGTLHARSIFRGFGGPPADARRLRELHDSVESAIEAALGDSPEDTRRFDIAAGNALVDWFEEDGRGQASNPEIWPYLTILVLPDLAVRRFGPDANGRLPRDRYLSGRRNIFYRAYLRSWLLGDLLSDPDHPLYEDDLVGLMERNLSADQRIARLVGEQIRRIPPGAARRTTTREGLKALLYELRVSDISSLSDKMARAVIRGCFEGGSSVTCSIEEAGSTKLGAHQIEGAAAQLHKEIHAPVLPSESGEAPSSSEDVGAPPEADARVNEGDDDHGAELLTPWALHTALPREALDAISSSRAARAGIVDLAREIVAVEEPVRDLRLARLIAGAHGLQRVRQARTTEILSAVRGGGLHIDGDGFVWTDRTARETFRGFRPGILRELAIDEVHPMEVRSAVATAMSRNGFADEEAVLRSALRDLGGSSMTSKVRPPLARAYQEITDEESGQG